MDVHKHKGPAESPVFEKLNQERLRDSREANDTARRTVEDARRLLDQSKELIERLHQKRRNH